MRALILGLGGLDDKTLLEIASGSLRERLAFGQTVPLLGYPTVNPAMAWTTVLTGLNPGQHGVFDALCWGSGGLVVNPHLKGATALWAHLAQKGCSTLAVGFPGGGETEVPGLGLVPAVEHNSPLAVPEADKLTRDTAERYSESLVSWARQRGYEVLAVNLSSVASSDQQKACLLAALLASAIPESCELICIAPWRLRVAATRVVVNDVLEELGFLKRCGDGGPWWKGISWHHTRAYSMGRGDIRINLRGREPLGTVEAGLSAHGLLLDLLRTVGDRWPVVPAFGLFAGPYASWAPDLIIDAPGVSFGSDRNLLPPRALEPEGFGFFQRLPVDCDRPMMWEDAADLVSRALTGSAYNAVPLEVMAPKDAYDLGLKAYVAELEQKYGALRDQYFQTARWATELEDELKRKNAILEAVEASKLHKVISALRKLIGRQYTVV